MSRRFHKRRRSILAQREMMAVMAQEQLDREEREAVAKLQRELDQLDSIGTPNQIDGEEAAR